MLVRKKAHHPLAFTLLLFLCLLPSAKAQTDPLPSWNNTTPRQTIIDFVRRVTRQGSPDFVPVDQRIATFDNDGTLWVEKPLPVQLFFVIDRVHQLAPKHPAWKTTQPFKGVLEGNLKAVAATGEKGLIQLMAATHAGMTVDQFQKIVSDWIATAQHPRFKRPFTQCVYQPMLELLAYLRSNGFKTYIVSGGGVEFMRPWTARVYGVPPEQVVGSSIKTKYQIVDGQPQLMRLPEINFIDNGDGKAIGINQYIGRRPIAAFGNSDGDQQMLEWTAGGPGLRLMLLVHHTDAAREYAYGRDDKLARLDTALNEAEAKGWLVVDMKNDWKTIFPPQH
jgi:phosphoserine phosphatase